MSPGDLGQVLKPFVFLDLFEMSKASFPEVGLHPHSGIATVTYLFEGSVRYEDTTGATGVLPAGGVEWFKAAHGARHGAAPGDKWPFPWFPALARVAAVGADWLRPRRREPNRK
jgi:redox-sensitive bicupin YhaK (pirin superfamily)